MSSVLKITRQRWATRDLYISKWLKKAGDTFDHGDEMCHLSVDGQTEVYRYLPGPNQSDPTGGIYNLMVDEGEQVGSWGYLLEYTDSAPGHRVSVRPRQSRPQVYRRRERYPRIFLNYRRTDADAFAGRLHESLLRAFGTDNVFMDVFSIRPGERSTWTVQQAVAHCDVMVCVIGTTWATLKDQGNTRRLDYQFDFVRREIVAALDRNIPIIPVLLPGAAVPDRLALPEEMRGFEDLQMLEISARYWEAGTSELFAAIQAQLPPADGGRVQTAKDVALSVISNVITKI